MLFSYAAMALLVSVSLAETPDLTPPASVASTAPSASTITPMYHYVGGSGQGVYTLAELVQIIEADPDGEHYLWMVGWPIWIPWQQVPEVASQLAPQGAATPSRPPGQPPPPPMLSKSPPLAVTAAAPPSAAAQAGPAPSPPEGFAAPMRAEGERLRLADSKVYVSTGAGFGTTVKTWGINRGASDRSLSSWEFAEVVGDEKTLQALEQTGKSNKIMNFVLAGVSAVVVIPLVHDLAQSDGEIGAGSFVLGFTGAVMAPVFGINGLMAEGKVRRHVISADYDIEQATAWMNSYNDGTPPPKDEEEDEVEDEADLDVEDAD